VNPSRRSLLWKQVYLVVVGATMVSVGVLSDSVARALVAGGGCALSATVAALSTEALHQAQPREDQ
jgi:uncharacterized membrane protein